MTSAKKSLGQNFLTSTAAVYKIIQAGNIQTSDTILEIGPGRGALTKSLVETKAHIIALEKDRDLVLSLRDIFASYTNIEIIEGDALTYTPPATSYKIIANIPYYITGAIFSTYLSHTHQPTMMVLLIQKEVATRICARNKKHSLLSLSVLVYGTPSRITIVNRGSFHPIPNVDSAVIKIDDISRKKFKDSKHEKIFFALIHAGFAHKRKLLIRNLESICIQEILEAHFITCSIPRIIRAEDVTLDTWLHLSLLLSTK